MRTLWTWTLSLFVAFMAHAMDPTYSPDDTAFVKDLKSRVVEWVSPESDVPLTSYLKDFEDKANSNCTTRIHVRLLTADGKEEQLITVTGTNALPVIGAFRCSVFDVARLISEAEGIDYRLNGKTRELIFQRRKGADQLGGYPPPAARSK